MPGSRGSGCWHSMACSWAPPPCSSVLVLRVATCGQKSGGPKQTSALRCLGVPRFRPRALVSAAHAMPGVLLGGQQSGWWPRRRSIQSPCVTLTRWTCAIPRGVGRVGDCVRVTFDLAFCWTAGDVAEGHLTLSALWLEDGAALNQPMTDILATLLHKGLPSLGPVAADGTRTRHRSGQWWVGDSGPAF